MSKPRLATHKEISENIRNCREQLDLTREQLAQRLSEVAGFCISYGWVRRIEVDLQTPSMQYLPLLNEALGISEPYLLLQPKAFTPNEDYRYRKRRRPRKSSQAPES